MSIPHRAAVPALCALFVACGLVSLRGDSATFDETSHIAAGVSYVERRDFRLNPEHPPLAKVLAGGALAVTGRGGLNYASAAWPEGNAWGLGWELLNGSPASATRRDPAARLVPARIAILFLGLLLVLAVYGWARELHGPDGALLALVLAVTCPTLLAHARLVTTDLAAALGAVITLWAGWRWLRAPSWRRVFLAGLALGAALLAKYSCVMLAPALAGLTVLAVLSRRIAWRHAATGLAGAFAVAVLVVWGGYGLRYSAAAEPGYALSWGFLERHESGFPASIRIARDHGLLPEAYLFGIAYARAESVNRVAFLDGEESITGWWRYFPEAFALKTPLAFIALLVWSIASGLKRTGGRSFNGWFVALPVAGFVAVSIASRFNIGHRHLTPIYPFLCIAIAPLAVHLATCGVRRLAVGTLVLSCIASFAFATPGYLSYFNVIAGGARGGHRHLVDSNLDWGQDLGRLRSWMEGSGVREVDLAYFGTADPRAYGIAFRKVAMFMDFYPELPAVRPEPGRHLAVSATLLQGLYLDRERAFARETIRRGFVTRARVEEFLRTRTGRVADGMVERGLVTPDQRRAIEADLIATWMDSIRTTLTPVGRAGDSILIYRTP